MLPPRPVFLALLAALLVPSAALDAQEAVARWGGHLAVGAAWQPIRQDGHLSRLGGHAAGALHWRPTRGGPLALRLEGLASAFSEVSDHVHSPCPPGVEPAACHTPVGPVRLHALTLGAFHAPAAGRRIAGLGAGWYDLAAHPTASGRGRPGAYAALGRRIAVGRPALVAEAQLHWLPGLAGGGSWHLPVRFALEF